MKKYIDEIYQKKPVFNSLGGRGVKNFLGSFAKTPSFRARVQNREFSRKGVAWQEGNQYQTS